jgi:hypothetical protein
MGRLQHRVGLAYIAPGPPPPISATSISTTVTPLTTAGDSTLRHLLTDDDRRRMCEYHESHLGSRILSHGIQFSTIKRNEKWIEQEQVYLLPHPNYRAQGL